VQLPRSDKTACLRGRLPQFWRNSSPLTDDDRRVDQANFAGIWARLTLAPVAAAAKLDRKVLAANVRHVQPADHQLCARDEISWQDSGFHALFLSHGDRHF
jgi:hypothetical protein